jgi:hypothetical protein
MSILQITPVFFSVTSEELELSEFQEFKPKKKRQISYESFAAFSHPTQRHLHDGERELSLKRH